MLRWINRIVGAILLLAVIVIGGIFLLPADKVAQIAAEQIRKATGREVTISCDVSLSIWPVLGASVGELEVGNADWSEQGPMLTASNAALGIDAAALLSGEIRITNIEAHAPTIRLESRADGRASWEFTDSSGSAQIETGTSPDRAPQALSIARLVVTDATLIYDAEGSDLVQYSDVDLYLDWPDVNGPARIAATLRPTAATVEVQATIDNFTGFLAGNTQAVDVGLTTSSGQAQLMGRASIAGDVAGDLTLTTSNTDGFLRALGLPGATLPPKLGQSVALRTGLTLTQDRQLSLRDLTADLGGNTLRGAADISLNGVPNVNAQLAASALDLSGLTADSPSGEAGSGSSASGWSRAPIDASGLAAFNGEISLRADSIDLGALQLGATRTLLRNDRSRMVFELRDVQAYAGSLSGEFVMNNRNGLSVGGKMFANGVEMKGILTDLAGITQLSGKADAELQFLGIGASVDAIMHSLSGKGALKTGSGRIDGMDLDRLMRSGDGSGGTTVFDSLGATFDVAEGVLRNKDLLVLLQNFEARGAGKIGLSAQDIDYVFTPKALRANDGKGLAIPVRITGAWANPRIFPDLEAAIDLNFAEEKKKAQEKVKKEVQKAVERELGVTVEDGESVEDALEKKLEDEVGKRLKRLFD